MRITFSDIKYFGTRFNQKRRSKICTLMNLLFSGLINFDGTIDPSVVNSSEIVLSDLWFYVWYLWKNNKDTIEVFKQMTSDTDSNAANAEKFVMAVKTENIALINGSQQTVMADVLSTGWTVNKDDLSKFIDRVFLKYRDQLKFPDLELLFAKLEYKLLQKEKRLTSNIEYVNKTINTGTGITVSVITDSKNSIVNENDIKT